MMLSATTTTITLLSLSSIFSTSFILATRAQDDAPPDDPLRPYTISAPSINATLIAYGARLTHLLVPDNNGDPKDVVVGYDDPAQYIKDTATNHTYFGPIVGRYANRIRNGTFTLPDSTTRTEEEYHIDTNDNSGLNTLHGGQIGYDARNWTVTHHSATTVTFTLLDPSGSQGFPGAVLTHATYTVTQGAGGGRLTCVTTSTALDAPTPIMLANHFYWNLGAFTSPTILNDTLHMPYATRFILTDGILVPTGALAAVSNHPILDFTAPKRVGADLSSDAAVGICGPGCTGYDNAFIIDPPMTTMTMTTDSTPLLSLSSDDTGIRMDVRSNQNSIQIYSCNFQNGTIPVKPSQRASGGVEYVNRHGCLAIEPQQWIDGINHPEWGQERYQIFGPDTQPAVNYATYDFSTFET